MRDKLFSFGMKNNSMFEKSFLVANLPMLIEASFDESGRLKPEIETFLNQDSGKVLKEIFGKNEISDKNTEK